METFSSSVSTLKVPTTLLSSPSHPHESIHHLKTYHTLPTKTNLHKVTKTNSLTQTKILSLSTPYFSIPTNNTLLISSPIFHNSPASGYAAALLDIAQCNSMALDLVNRDVKRFLKLMHTKNVGAVLESPFVGVEEKGVVMRLVAKKGRFNKVLVSLVKMLVGKSKVGIVKDVLEEFVRIYDELSYVNHGLIGGV